MGEGVGARLCGEGERRRIDVRFRESGDETAGKSDSQEKGGGKRMGCVRTPTKK